MVVSLVYRSRYLTVTDIPNADRAAMFARQSGLSADLRARPRAHPGPDR